MRNSVAGCILGALSAVIASLPAQAETKLIKKRESDAHEHHFYSAQFANPDNVIVYVVCNQTSAGSDFFWAKAAFGVGENDPIPAHTCLERDDYIDGSSDGAVPKAQVKTSEAYVKDKNAEIPTVIWCDYLTLDRCDNGFPAKIASWLSELRIFGEKESNRLAPIVKADVRLADGKYKVQIEYSEAAGSIVVVARNADSNTAFFQNLDNKTIATSRLGDNISLDDSPVQIGLSQNNPVLQVNNEINTKGIFGFYFTNQGKEAVSLSFIIRENKGIRLRFDSIQLDTLAQ